jgi:hypothetical protein
MRRGTTHPFSFGLVRVFRRSVGGAVGIAARVRFFGFIQPLRQEPFERAQDLLRPCVLAGALDPADDEFCLARGFYNAVAPAFGLLPRGPSGYALFQAARLAMGDASDVLKPLRDIVGGERVGQGSTQTLEFCADVGKWSNGFCGLASLRILLGSGLVRETVDLRPAQYVVPIQRNDRLVLLCLSGCFS